MLVRLTQVLNTEIKHKVYKIIEGIKNPFFFVRNIYIIFMASMTGIYQIRNIQTGKVYIGSSENMPKRKLEHFWNLENLIHHSRHLQNSYLKRGKENFIFEILEECTKEQLIEREQHYLDTILFAQEYCLTKGQDSRFLEYGYNICPIAGRSTFSKHSPETLETMKQNTTNLWQQEWYVAKQKKIKTPEWHKQIMAKVWTEEFREESSRRQTHSRAKQKEELGEEAYREKWLAINGDEAKREASSNKMKEKWQDEEYRSKIHTEEANKKLSDKQKVKWEDEEYRKKQTEILGSKEVCDKRMASKKKTQSDPNYINPAWKKVEAVNRQTGEVVHTFRMRKEAEEFCNNLTKKQCDVDYYIKKNHKDYLGFMWRYS